MQPLPLHEQRHVQAAEGWLGLGNWAEANEELEQISASLRAHPSVLFIRYDVYAKAKKWDGATEIAGTLVTLFPERPEAWICWAYATRRKTGGGVLGAKTILVQAEPQFPSDYLISYNLACYSCQLGELKEAIMWLERAIDLAGEKDIRLKALEDEDLQPLWWRIGEI